MKKILILETWYQETAYGGSYLIDQNISYKDIENSWNIYKSNVEDAKVRYFMREVYNAEFIEDNIIYLDIE